MERNLTSDDIDEIIPAACEGKIDTLFADCDAEVFGRFNPAKKSVEVVDNRDPAVRSC